jgi:hypothetical protein
VLVTRVGGVRVAFVCGGIGFWLRFFGCKCACTAGVVFVFGD